MNSANRLLLLAAAAWIALSLSRAGLCADAPAPKPKTPADVPVGVELLENGGLEMPCPLTPPAQNRRWWDATKTGGYYADWPPRFTFHDRNGSGPVELDEDVSLEGRRSMRLTCVLFGNNGFLFYYNVNQPAREGDAFHVSVYVRNEVEAVSYRSLTVDFGMAGGKRETRNVAAPRLPDGPTDWRKIEFTAIAPKDAVALVGVSFKISNVPMYGRIWWDALSLVKIRGGGEEE